MTHFRFWRAHTAAALGALVAYATLFAPVACAGVVDYTINFSAGTGPTPTGTFQYDASLPPGARFIDFEVIWKGLIFDLTDSANAPIGFGDPSACGLDAFRLMQGIACSPHQTGYPKWAGAGGENAVGFQITDMDVSGEHVIGVGSSISGYYSGISPDGGSLLFATPVPEPTDVMLMLAGGGMLLFLKLRSRVAIQARANDLAHHLER